MKRFRKLNYDNVPGVRGSLKILIKSLIRKLYIDPIDKIISSLNKYTDKIRRVLYVRTVSRNIDRVIYNDNGIPGLFYVASYTDEDEGFIPGMIESCRHFNGIILYKDNVKRGYFNYNEGARFHGLTLAARKNGATWVFIGSPKTRFSKQFRSQVESFIELYRNKPVVLNLKERYLWESFDQYTYVAVEGNINNGPNINKLFSITNGMKFDQSPIHAQQYPVNYKTIIKTEASRYYLGRFNLRTMEKKAKYYSSKDGKDYSYLMNTVEPIKHNEDIIGVGSVEADLLSRW